jgi:predicted glycoside hydrolase/deacetylase ChbG (UPF0249 family)
MTRTLIVNADDFGRTRGVSAGIVHAHLHGLVSTTTALVNLPGALQDVAQASRQAPTLGLGVHLNLTLGRPVLNPSLVPTLVTPDGTFHPPDALAASAGRIDRGHVAGEWRAQIEAFLSTGATLDHLDSHHHAALFSPNLWEACLGLAAEFGCGVRPPAPRRARDDILFSRFPKPARRYAAGDARRRARALGIPCPGDLVTRFYAHRATLPTLLSILAALPDGATELMCHPGWVDEQLQNESGYAQERESELLALTSVRTLQLVRRRGIRLSTYRSWMTPA